MPLPGIAALLAAGSKLFPQEFLRPAADISNDVEWSTTEGSFFAAIDEVTPDNDTTFIDCVSDAGVIPVEVQIRYGTISRFPPPQTPHTVRITHRSVNLSAVGTVVVSLEQGTGPVIAQIFSAVPPSGVYTTVTRVLTAPEIATISDYSDLRLVSTTVDLVRASGGPATGEYRLTQSELEVGTP